MEEVQRIGFFGKMIGSQNYCRALGLGLSGHEVVFLSNGEAEERMDVLSQCDVVALGLAAFPHEREAENRVAEMLTARGVPFVALADLPDSVYRFDGEGSPVFRGAAAIICPTEENRRLALEIGWKQAYACGLPPHLKQSYDQMLDGSRVELKDTRGNDLSRKDPLLFYPGTKSFVLDWEVLNIVVAVACDLFNDRFVVCYKPHPSLVNEPANAAALANINRALSGVSQLNWKAADMTMPQIISVADLTIYGGMNSDSLAAAYAGRPGMCVLTPTIRERNRKQGAPTGVPLVAEHGGLIAVDLENLEEEIGEFFRDDSYRKGFRYMQRKSFPSDHVEGAMEKTNAILLTLARQSRVSHALQG